MTIAAAALLAYALTVLVACATPGPSMLAVITTALSRGRASAVAMSFGIFLGDLPLVLLALFGMALIAQLLGTFFVVVKLIGAAYLIWLGVKLLRAPPMDLDAPLATRRGPWRSFVLGAAVALGNPKAIFFHAGLIPMLIDPARATALDMIVILSIVGGLNLSVMLTYAIAASRLRRYVSTPRRLRWANRIAGGAMIGTGAVIATR
jgi:threonine/homoserine/homoserine lactone efflux protein